MMSFVRIISFPISLWAYAPERRNLDHKSAVKNQHHQACRIRDAPRSIGPKVLGQFTKVLGPRRSVSAIQAKAVDRRAANNASRSAAVRDLFEPVFYQR